MNDELDTAQLLTLPTTSRDFSLLLSLGLGLLEGHLSIHPHLLYILSENIQL